jgi:uncharacterized protein (TIGR02996 family)
MAFPRNPDLEARLIADPDDDLGFEIYGDWLNSHGAPHGELIQIQRALRGEPRNVALRRREAELMERHGAELVGPSVASEIHRLGWSAGFVESAELWLEGLIELTAHPAGLVPRELVVHGRLLLQPVIDHLVRMPPTLRSLRLEGGRQGMREGPVIWGVTALWQAQPRLTQLTVQDGELELGNVASSCLRELVLRPGTLTADHLRALAAASLPALERLELWFEHDVTWGREHDEGNRWDFGDPRCAIGLHDVRVLLATAQLPALRDLRLVNTTLGDGLCDIVADSPLAPQLRRLALNRSTITTAGAAVLGQHRARFARLEELDLDRNRIADDSVLGGLPRDRKLWQQAPVDPAAHFAASAAYVATEDDEAEDGEAEDGEAEDYDAE